MHSHTKIHNEHLKDITKIEKHKKLNMTEHKTHMKITKIDKSKTTERHLYHGTQSRITTTLW